MRNSVLRLIALPVALILLFALLMLQDQGQLPIHDTVRTAGVGLSAVSITSQESVDASEIKTDPEAKDEAASTLNSSNPDEPETVDFPSAKLDEFFGLLYHNHTFMGSVAILSGGEIIYRYSAGYADVAAEIPNNHKTHHRIGSVTKPFTATLILQLEGEGKLSLDQPLSDFFDGFPGADKITLAHMLYHRSGLFNFTNDPGYTSWMTEARSRDEMLELMRGYDLQFEPDAQMQYSNANYVLLGFIIEDVTGKSYQEALQERIAGPLGLKNTYFPGKISAERNESGSYRWVEEWVRLPETDMSIPHGAGALVSTPTDMVRFVRALFKGELLEPASLEKMTKLRDHFGMGLIFYPYHNKDGYGHTGGIDGYQSNLAAYPDDDLYISIAANALSWSNNSLLLTLLDAWHGKPVELPDFDNIALSEEHLKALAGNYASAQFPLQIRVWEENGRLMAQATGQGAIPLDASSETRFRFDPAGLVMEFHTNEVGEYLSFTLFQAGMEILFERK